MGVRVKNPEVKPGICVHDMKDGQIAKIILWRGTAHTKDVGRIVQRVNKIGPEQTDILITLGYGEGKCYDALFDGPRREDCRVEVLPQGTTLEIL